MVSTFAEQPNTRTCEEISLKRSRSFSYLLALQQLYLLIPHVFFAARERRLRSRPRRFPFFFDNLLFAWRLNETAVWKVTSFASCHEKNASARKTRLYFLCLLSFLVPFCSLSRENENTLYFFTREPRWQFTPTANECNEGLFKCWTI